MIDIDKLPRDGVGLERFKSGQVIIRDGEVMCDKMYILLSGSADVFKSYQEFGEMKITTLTQGDFFGEMSLFLSKARTATVVAIDEVIALSIDRLSARDFFEKQPDATYSLIQTLCSRLENTNINMADKHVKYEKSIVSLKQEKSELEVAANVDALTGVFNRRLFMETAGERIRDAHNKSINTFIAMIDLDHFKSINDTYGHQAGDMVLKSVAGKVSDSIRPCDIFARYGGEEFVLLIIGSQKEDVLSLVERIRQKIQKEPIEFENKRISITASFGITAISPENNLATAISFADEALYMAKNGGRNKSVFYDAPK